MNSKNRCTSPATAAAGHKESITTVRPAYTCHKGADYLKAMVGRSATVIAITALAAATSLTACSGMTRQEQGTAAGAVIGGVAGHVVGGGLLGTAAGAAVGGVIGHEVTKKK